MEKVMTLRQHRMANGLTIRALAERVKAQGNTISTQTIVAIEKGKPARIQSFRKLASALGVDLMGIREYQNMVMTEEQ